jgi:phosphatidate phosphatase APP1
METEKKAFLLLKSLIFHYHGLDDEEEEILNNTAEKLNAHKELKWANDFIAKDYTSAFERSREFLNKNIGNLPTAKKLEYLFSVWKDSNSKGYLTEMETTAFLNLAKEWNINKELMRKIKG